MIILYTTLYHICRCTCQGSSRQETRHLQTAHPNNKTASTNNKTSFYHNSSNTISTNDNSF